MLLKRLLLDAFRSYDAADFSFSPSTTVIVGHNTAGKTNILEAIFLLSTGKSFRTEKPLQMIQLGKQMGRARGVISNNEKETVLEYFITVDRPIEDLTDEEAFVVKQQYRVNGIARRRSDFAYQLKTLLFIPAHLDLISGGPSERRAFLDEVLTIADYDYSRAIVLYEKALKQRNALLRIVKETGERRGKEFEYWDKILAEHGKIVTQKRETFLTFINDTKKEFLEFFITYDKSTISEERLAQYADAEVGAGVTLVGPHRDDFIVHLLENDGKVKKDVKSFGSRGQQRLVVLDLKIAQLLFVEKCLGERPLLLLDDIFSELDSRHIEAVLSMTKKQQTIITTTHEEFIQAIGTDTTVIDIGTNKAT